MLDFIVSALHAAHAFFFSHRPYCPALLHCGAAFVCRSGEILVRAYSRALGASREGEIEGELHRFSPSLFDLWAAVASPRAED